MLTRSVDIPEATFEPVALVKRRSAGQCVNQIDRLDRTLSRVTSREPDERALPQRYRFSGKCVLPRSPKLIKIANIQIRP